MSKLSKGIYKTVFDNSPVGLVIINEDTTLNDVNDYMFDVFKLTPKDIEGKMFGNVFNCSTISGNNQACGTLEACNQCALRKGISSVLNIGIKIADKVIEHHFIINGKKRGKWFKISASRIVLEGEIYAIVSFVDITIQKEYEQLLSNQLSLDLATGTTNKYALINTLKSLSVGKEDLTVAMIDFDDFKLINDNYGHVIGDKVLNNFCDAANANTRENDIVGRFGGEEFMLVFPGALSRTTINILQRIYSSFQEQCNKEFSILPTISVGINEFSAQKMKEMTVEDIIQEVDSNLYMSKIRGKNMITIDGISIPF